MSVRSLAWSGIWDAPLGLGSAVRAAYHRGGGSDGPVKARPDWICEVLSPSNARNDLLKKLDLYRQVGIPHYWIADPETETLTVHRLVADGYLIALRAGREETVHAEPFDAIELRVGTLFGDES